MIRILAGNYTEARTLAQAEGLPPSDWVNVSDLLRIRGAKRGATMWTTGAWRKREDAAHILELAFVKEFIVVEK